MSRYFGSSSHERHGTALDERTKLQPGRSRRSSNPAVQGTPSEIEIAHKIETCGADVPHYVSGPWIQTDDVATRTAQVVPATCPAEEQTSAWVERERRPESRGWRSSKNVTGGWVNPVHANAVTSYPAYEPTSTDG